MKSIKAIIISILLYPCLSHASIFDFSYLFQQGYGDNRGLEPTLIKGYFSGERDGDYVRNIDDIHISIQGREFSNNLISILFAPEIGNPWVADQEGLVSFDASLNNFMFTNDTYPTQGTNTNYFLFVNYAPDGYVLRQATNDNGGYSYGFDDNSYANTSWTLVERVPEPSTLILILAGFLVIAIQRVSRSRA